MLVQIEEVTRVYIDWSAFIVTKVANVHLVIRVKNMETPASILLTTRPRAIMMDVGDLSPLDLLTLCSSTKTNNNDNRMEIERYISVARDCHQHSYKKM